MKMKTKMPISIITTLITAVFAIGVIAIINYSNNDYVKCDVSEEEMTELGKLYNHTFGNNWYSNENWFQGDPCLETKQWFGVICDNNNNNNNNTVIGFALQQNNLKGSLDFVNFTVFSQLQYVYFEINHLTGELPSTLGQLSLLTAISFTNNSLSGVLPSEYGLLKNLQMYASDQNFLTGTLPSQWGAMEKLTYIDLSHCDLLSGDPPYNCNHITGTIPDSWSDLINLQEMFIDWLRLTGSLPTSFGKLTNLEYFYVNDNLLESTIPTEFASWSKIKKLRLNDNQFIGEFPSSVIKGENFPVLSNLWMQDNSFEGVLPYFFDNLTVFSLEFPHISPISEFNVTNNGWQLPVPQWCDEIKQCTSNIKDDIGSSSSGSDDDNNNGADEHQFSKDVLIAVSGLIICFIIVVGVIEFSRYIKKHDKREEYQSIGDDN